MSSLVVSAPGKVIIHGEHAVVYGKPALATSLDLRCYLCLTFSQDGQITLNAPDLDLRRTWSVADIAHRLKLPTTVTGDIDSSNGEKQLDLLKDLAGIERGEEVPATPAVATLVFLFLLVNIYGTNFESLSGLHVTIISTLPFGAGLGSSAAYSVCLSAAFLQAMTATMSCKSTTNTHACTTHADISTPLKQPVPSQALSTNTTERPPPDTVSGSDESALDCGSIPEEIQRRLEKEADVKSSGLGVWAWSQRELLDSANEWGFKAEKIIHGTPSGIDNSISTFGGAIRFQGGNITHLERISNVEIMLINTRVPRSTKKMVSGVRARYEKFPGVIQPVLDSMESIVDTAQQLLKDLDSQSNADDTYHSLQELFSINHHLLNAIGVGHPSLDRACSIAHQFGLGAKLTGGGGGGCAIALIPPGYSETRITELKQALQEAGFDSWKTVIGTRGVTLHT